MKLYNTLTRQVQTIQPINPPEVTVYTCGPTVYDYPHIGNWFTFIRYDLLIRTLKASGFNPKWVMNITDVGHLTSDADTGEDKLEKGAKREGKSAWDIANYYYEYFTHGLNRLNMTKPDIMPRATEHIKEQVDLIKKLESKGFTYIIDDGVYFETSKFPHYADFAQLDLDEQQAGARIEYNPQKHRPTDFALWKFSPKDRQRDMEWDSPWGKGFPGWHIECSAMSMKYLGNTLDIHAGGIDHIPVHHTNEIAQSEAATDQKFANLWMHTNHISIEGNKISKSANNSVTLEDIEAKKLNLMALRLHVYESHYRSQSKFTWKSLTAAEQRLNTLQALADLVWQPKSTTSTGIDFSSEYQNILNYLQDDLNSPAMLAKLSELQDKLEVDLLGPNDIEPFKMFLNKLDDLLGFNLAIRKDITVEQNKLIEARQTARDLNKWDQADEIRQQLLIQGIGLRDTPHGVIWFKQ